MIDASDRHRTDRGMDAAARLPVPPPLAELSAREGGLALFLDFDGTLVEIADHPDKVAVPADLGAMLERLAERLGGRLALVSGRSLGALDRMLGNPQVAMAGSHGGEIRLAGQTEIEAMSRPLPDEVVAGLERFAASHGHLLVEPKPFSVAVHYRDRPEACAPLLGTAREIAARHGLAVKHGKMVVELVMPGSDKGSAVSRFLERPPFAGSFPVFAGDDTTDEDAFRVLAASGGAGILVGPARETAARWRLDGVAALHEWLRQDPTR